MVSQEAAMRDDSGHESYLHVGVWEIFVDELRPLLQRGSSNSRVNERYLGF